MVDRWVGRFGWMVGRKVTPGSPSPCVVVVPFYLPPIVDSCIAYLPLPLYHPQTKNRRQVVPSYSAQVGTDLLPYP